MRPICCLVFNSGSLFSCNSFCLNLRSSNVKIFFESTNSFAFTGPMPYIFANMFIGLFFSFSTSSSVPVVKNSSNFFRIFSPILGNFKLFSSCAEVISLLSGNAIYFFNSFIALLYAATLKTSSLFPLFFTIFESSSRTLIKFIMLLPPDILLCLL